MAKIYLKNIPLSTITNNLQCFSKFCKNQYTYIRICSKEDGTIFIINDKNLIYFLEVQDELIKHKNITNVKYGNIDLLVDYNLEIKIPVLSQLPVDYSVDIITRREYYFNKIKLVVDGIYEKKTNNINTCDFKKKNLLDDMVKTFVPIDYYLEYIDNDKNSTKDNKDNKYKDKQIDFTSPFVKEELNGFLLHLI